MLDVQLAAALVAALPPGAQLVLVGDINQLQPVGPGCPLIDLLEMVGEAAAMAASTALAAASPAAAARAVAGATAPGAALTTARAGAGPRGAGGSGGGGGAGGGGEHGVLIPRLHLSEVFRQQLAGSGEAGTIVAAAHQIMRGAVGG